jgi:SAM-dependent methyltransferase
LRRSGQSGPHEQEEPILLGDPTLAEVCAKALLAVGEVERYTHGFHTWPAQLHPDAAALLVRQFGGARVLDPFCGGGTVLVEAVAAGKQAVGRDISPVAVMVSQGRADVMTEEQLTAVRSAARRMTEEARKATTLPPTRILEAVRRWYPQHVLCELEALRQGIAEADPAVRPALRFCFSSILVKTSYRRSDTSAQRQVRERPAQTAAILFHKKVREYGRRVASLREVVPAGTPAPDIALCDARRIELDEPADAVITSPPYPSTYDYVPMQHLRHIWLELEDVDGEIGARRSWRLGAQEAQRRWVEDTRSWMARAARQLRVGGHLVVVIGDGLYPGGIVDTSAPTEDAARAAGLRSVARASLERSDHARQTTRSEHCFVFARTSA